MKLNVTPVNLEHAKELSSMGVDGLVVGEKRFAIRTVADFSLEDIKCLSELGKVVYVQVNKIFYDQDEEAVTAYLRELAELENIVVCFADMMIYQIISENKFKLEMIYATETTITNSFFSEYYHKLGVNKIDVAKEITLEEIEKICSKKAGDIHANVQGHIYMFYSIRPIIENFKEKTQKEFQKEELYLYDEERDCYYPVLEDETGSHVLSSVDVCMINHLDKLKDSGIDELKFDGFGYTKEQITKVTEWYIEAFAILKQDREKYINEKNNFLEQVKEVCPNKKFGTGFYFKKTTY